MNNADLAKSLAKRGARQGMCLRGQAEMATLTDIDAMIEMFLKDIDFCLANNFPRNEVFRTYGKGIMEKHGVFLDEEAVVEDMPKVVCLGSCNGKTKTTGFNVSEIFVKHDSELNIVAKDNAFVMVDVFDNAQIFVYASDNAKVCVNRYGNAVVKQYTEGEATIKVEEKNKSTY